MGTGNPPWGRWWISLLNFKGRANEMSKHMKTIFMHNARISDGASEYSKTSRLRTHWIFINRFQTLLFELRQELERALGLGALGCLAPLPVQLEQGVPRDDRVGGSWRRTRPDQQALKRHSTKKWKFPTIKLHTR